MALSICGLTLSIEYKDVEYGNGSSRFVSASSKTPEGEAIPLDNMEEVFKSSLQIHSTLWKSIMAQRWVDGVLKDSSGVRIKLAELGETIAIFDRRVAKAINLVENNSDIPKKEVL